MNWRILEGDCRDVLRSLPAQSVHACVTSPPYFGLRDYGAAGQVGLEPTPDEFVAALVAVFRGVRRVLRDDGTAWLNLGDSYGDGKQLQGIPWRVAFAMQRDGWVLRSDIIWSKPNPMPESVTDRPTKAHEYVFLLSKGPRYFYDADAIRDPSVDPVGASRGGSLARFGADEQLVAANAHRGDMEYRSSGSANKRSVWTIATQPYAGAHFATFPPKLIEPCILAGAPERACGECGAPWVRVVERGPSSWETRKAAGATRGNLAMNGNVGAGTQRGVHGDGVTHDLDAAPARTLGFEPSCSHCDGSASGVVLDPFAGAGTTGLVALQHGREFIGIELNPEYAAMARDRIDTAVRLGFRSPQSGPEQINGQEALFA